MREHAGVFSIQHRTPTVAEGIPSITVGVQCWEKTLILRRLASMRAEPLHRLPAC